MGVEGGGSPPPLPVVVGWVCAVLHCALLCCAVMCCAVLNVLCCACAHGDIACFSFVSLAFPWFSLSLHCPTGGSYHLPEGGAEEPGTQDIYIYVCICDTYMYIHIHIRVLMYTSKCTSITLTYTHHIYIYSYVFLLLCIAFRIFLDGRKFLVVPRQTQLLELLHNLIGA